MQLQARGCTSPTRTRDVFPHCSVKVLERTRRPQQGRREEAALAQTAPSMCAEAAGACRNPQHIYFSASRRVLSSLPWKTQAAGPAPTGEHLLQSEPSR